MVLVNYFENGINLWYGGQQVDGDIIVVLIKVLQDLWCLDVDCIKCVGQVEICQGIYYYYWSEDFLLYVVLLYGMVVDGFFWLNQCQMIVIYYFLQVFFVFFCQLFSFVW